ncbi:hypothetical protein CLV58_103141 [Spirosoma oryzae]|uniref:Uncharacterized protein n=1 Tax=Spirosoma oryzae TaxID=1469603 RepID=A0A2T0TES4_9BACT|nr:hypothetical protein CLV58_103141 [Spirosoma oryzae]
MFGENLRFRDDLIYDNMKDITDRLIQQWMDLLVNGRKLANNNVRKNFEKHNFK